LSNFGKPVSDSCPKLQLFDQPGLFIA